MEIFPSETKSYFIFMRMFHAHDSLECSAGWGFYANYGKFSGMARPPQVNLTDVVILDVIRQHRTMRGVVRGSAVRRELLARFGAPAGTERVYRLIRDSENDALNAQLEALRGELDATRTQLSQEQARAELAEHREQSHFDKWAGEIHELRRKLAALEGPGASRAEMENEHLRMLKELTRANAAVRQLTELLQTHGISLPVPPTR